MPVLPCATEKLLNVDLIYKSHVKITETSNVHDVALKLAMYENSLNAI